MKRYMVYLSLVVLLVVIWISLKLSPVYKDAALVDVMPWYLLISLGCACLAKLGLDLLTFSDFPVEVKKLEADIAAARLDLQKRGYKPT